MTEIRGIVMESGRGWAIILLSNGEYRKVRTLKLVMPGDIYQGRIYRNHGWPAVAAAAVLIMLVSIFDFFNVVAYAQVSSGIEVGVNRWNRVVSVSAVNSAGEAILPEINVKGQKLEQALETLIEQALEQESGSVEADIIVIVKKPDDKSVPPGIAKKLEQIIAQEGSNEYELKRIKVDSKEQVIYGLTAIEENSPESSDLTDVGSENKASGKNSSNHNSNNSTNNSTNNSSTNQGANPGSEDKNENYQQGRNKLDNEEQSTWTENDTEEETQEQEDKSKPNKPVKQMPEQVLDKIPDKALNNTN